MPLGEVVVVASAAQLLLQLFIWVSPLDAVFPESEGAAGYQDGRLAGYSWPWLVISLPASHFSYFTALSAIWQTAKLKTAKGDWPTR